MRRRLSTKEVLRILRIASLAKQLEVGVRAGADQSTISKIERGEMVITPDWERRYVDACGGSGLVRLLIDHLQNLLDRLERNNRLPLFSA